VPDRRRSHHLSGTAIVEFHTGVSVEEIVHLQLQSRRSVCTNPFRIQAGRRQPPVRTSRLSLLPLLAARFCGYRVATGGLQPRRLTVATATPEPSHCQLLGALAGRLRHGPARRPASQRDGLRRAAGDLEPRAWGWGLPELRGLGAASAVLGPSGGSSRLARIRSREREAVQPSSDFRTSEVCQACRASTGIRVGGRQGVTYTCVGAGAPGPGLS